MLAERLKLLRAEKGITQVELAEKLNVSKGTVGMWETGKRKPSYETLNEMTDIFDRKIDYILGYSDDTSSPILSEDDINQIGMWALEEDFTETVFKYLMLDQYGQYAVEALIRAETRRCRDQETLVPKENYRVSIRVNPDEDDE